jgi:hypothetical protein
VSKFDSILLRQLLWLAFYDMTRDALYPTSRFLDLVLNNIGRCSVV